MTETEKSSDLGEIAAVTMRLEQMPTDCSMRTFSHCSAVTQKPINMVLAARAELPVQ